MSKSDSEATLQTSATSPLAEKEPEPPVVARMIIEIRSDGLRTIARGAIEDAHNGERVTLEAHGSSPMSLAASLAKNLLTTPLLARHALGNLIRDRIRGRLGGRG